VKFFLILYLSFSIIPYAFSASSNIETKEKKTGGLKDKVYTAHDVLSKKLMTTTNWIDSFFGNKKYLEEQNGSRLRFFNIFSKFESDKFRSQPAFKFNFRFPNLQKKLQINFEKRGKNETNLTAIPETRLSTEDGRTEDDLRSSASYFLDNMLDFKIKVTAGARIRWPVKLFGNLRISREFLFPRNWEFRIISNSFWEQVEGYGESFSADFSKQLSENFLFRFVNETTWLDDSDITYVAHGPSLYQRLSVRRVISYNARVNYNNRPTYHLQNYALSVIYRQNIMKQFLFYELVPQVSFDKSRNFKAKSGIALKIELTIGGF
jgi:hypothetical protein